MRAFLTQALSVNRLVQIRPGYRVALIEKYLGNTAHTSAADPDKVDRPNATHLWNLVKICVRH
jgi:hypothetical protein